ncbi:helix-turn-helix transcriptional regulator [Croceicoccus sp. Ery5]|uniref:helix-turn-helix domain-containing protein n=1 Tax=Croceicoccus sp. Ery5 TaxID=1703340 RepID=UPI001E6228A4|nr:helix-turn-helix transcriptional regulator [Croceicoccus sp. Ery5]
MAKPNDTLVTTERYRHAVGRIIAAIRKAEGLSDRQMAQRLDCSAGTIRNARIEATSLDPAVLIRIEQQFGPGAIDPLLALAGVRCLATGHGGGKGAAGNPTLAIVEALHGIVEMQAAHSEGGRRITNHELRQILPELRAGRAALDALIARVGEG